MTYKEVAAMVAEFNIPFAYYQFPEGTEQATPFACFWFDSSDDLYADNSNFQKIEHLTIELYTDTKDYALEKEAERVIRSHGLAWSKTDNWIDSEKMLQVAYEMDVVITEET